MSNLRRRDLDGTVVLKIDKYRRVTLPTEVLEYLEYTGFEPLDISIEHARICLRKFNAETLYTSHFGVLRSVDDKNRIYIPREYCDILHIEPDKTEFTFFFYSSSYHDSRPIVGLVPVGYGGTHQKHN